jgi:hypothetical protein
MDQGLLHFRYWPFATFPSAAKLGRYRGIADMIALVAGQTWSRMTELGHGELLVEAEITKKS